MKRRTFIRLAGLAATYWLPLESNAAKNVSALSAHSPYSADLNGQRNAWAESQPPNETTVIKVTGVGGAGISTINQMIRKGAHRAENVFTLAGQ